MLGDAIASKNPSRCSGCFVAHYCSAHCQKIGWKKHKVECKETRSKYKVARLLKFFDFESNQPKSHRYTVDQPAEVPCGQFVVKVQVMFSRPKGKYGLLVYNRERSLEGNLLRVHDPELYDKLEKEVKENGFQGYKGFFPAICTRDAEEDEGYKLEINPDKLLPLEIW